MPSRVHSWWHKWHLKVHVQIVTGFRFQVASIVEIFTVPFLPLDPIYMCVHIWNLRRFFFNIHTHTLSLPGNPCCDPCPHQSSHQHEHARPPLLPRQYGHSEKAILWCQHLRCRRHQVNAIAMLYNSSTLCQCGWGTHVYDFIISWLSIIMCDYLSIVLMKCFVVIQELELLTMKFHLISANTEPQRPWQ